MIVPAALRQSCGGVPERQAWLIDLPRVVRELTERWSLTLGDPFDGENVSCAWVAPAVQADGTRVVFKIGMPHMEGRDEIAGLRFWNGDPTVHVLQADEALDAMILERCEPGTPLRELPEREQDVVIAGLLRRMWHRPQASHSFRPLAALIAHWAADTNAAAADWPDAGLVREGLRVFDDLIREPADEDVVLATDLHAGNVLSARREPWLVIDPKPFVGERAYDATQHLFNCTPRVLTAPRATIARFADLLEVDAERVRLWMFARVAASPRDTWSESSITLARALA